MPTPISKKKFIAVEGKDELNLLTALFKHMGLETLEARDVAGVTQFKDKIQALKNDPEFYKITSFGVIRDSNGSAEDAFRSVCGMLKSVGLAVPDRPLSMAAGKPSVAVMIMPGSNVEGQMLEDLCLEAVKEDPAMPCVADFFQCLEKTNLSGPKNMAKARIHAFLASRERPGLELGVAASKDYLPWDSPAFSELKEFIQMIAS